MNALKNEIFLNDAMNKHGDEVYRLALCRLQNKTDAEDVYQEVFLKLFSTKTDFEDDEHLKAWHERIDLLEGVKMYVTVTFTDGQVQTQTYTLHSGKLAVEYNEEYQIDLDLFDSSRHLTGKLAVGDEPYIYGVYAELES